MAVVNIKTKKALFTDSIFQKVLFFSITRIILSHWRSEQFWKQSTITEFHFSVKLFFNHVPDSAFSCRLFFVRLLNRMHVEILVWLPTFHTHVYDMYVPTSYIFLQKCDMYWLQQCFWNILTDAIKLHNGSKPFGSCIHEYFTR